MDPIVPAARRQGVSGDADSETRIPPRVSGAWNLAHQNLVRKGGDFGFSHAATATGLELRLILLPELEIRSAAERDRWDENIGDQDIRLDADGEAWRWRGSVAFPFMQWLTPSVGGGWNSNGGWENALALQGRTRAGLSWAAAASRRSWSHPLRLNLENYAPFPIPFLLREKAYALSLGWRRRPWEMAWTGRFSAYGHPATRNDYYTLSDSGRNLENSAGLAWDDSGSRGRQRVSVEARYAAGTHVYQGIKNSTRPYSFGYQETRPRDYALRAEARQGSQGWEAGIFAGFSGADWRGLRPEIPSGRYLWDRNGVLESYEGTILGIFNRETWLFDGDLNYRQWASGTWVGRNGSHWKVRCGLAYNRLDLEGRGRLTRKTSTLLIAYTEKEYFPEFSGLELDLLTPELRFTGRWGGAFLETALDQAFPLRLRLRESEGPGAPAPASSSYSGGTRAGVKIGWGVF